MNFDEIGEIALGSRLRALSNTITDDAQHIYKLYEVELKPKWFPVFYFLSHQKTGKSITTIANEIGHSHPSVIKIVREMAKANLVTDQKDKNDRRKTNIVLTQKGMDISSKIEVQYSDVQKAIQKILQQTTHNLWLALQEFEYLLREESIFTRVAAQKKLRESSKIEVLDYLPEHHSDFKKLNEEWIITNFKIEDADRKALNHPQEYIIDRGGKIVVAIQDGIVLGVCALLKMEDEHYDYELAKMAVSPVARGKGVGYLLGKSIIEKAKSLGASKIYLESNTILKPAVSLYRKLGFKKVVGHSTPYERCNIQMELQL